MLGIILTVCCLVVALGHLAHSLNAELDDHWDLFKLQYSKSYLTKDDETIRRMIWEEHVEYIAKHNREYDMGLHTFTLGLNEYADMTTEEFVSVMNGYKAGSRHNGTLYLEPSDVQLPDTVDWRQKGYVTGVKNQGQCGSCWAFSTTGSLEGQHFRATGRMVSLSEQNLVDCSIMFGNFGCLGGMVDRAFNYIKSAGGIDTEDSYPYRAINGICRFSKQNIGATITGHVDIPSGNENALQSAIATVGPVSVAIDAGHNSFQLYKSGIYNEPACSSSNLDHAVLAVGYGTSNGQAYWLVKNSWGTNWGAGGYIQMSRNKNNQCGIASQASYPTV